MMLFRDSGIYVIAKILPGILSFAALSLYTHLLTPDDYGTYVLILSTTILFYSVIYNWLAAGTLRFWSSQSYNKLEFMSTLTTSYIRISLVLLVFVILGVIVFWGETEAAWIIGSYSLLLIYAFFQITQHLFTARIEPQFYAYLAISYSILSLFLGSSFAYFGFGATGVLSGITLGFLIPSLFVLKKVWMPIQKNVYNKQLFKRLLTYGLPLASAALLEEITKVSDRYMLAWFHDKAQAGLYAVGFDLPGNTILLIMSAINLAAYPVIIKLLETEGKKPAMEYFRQYAILLLGLSIPVVVGLNLIGPDLIYLLIDEKYQASVIYLLPWITFAVFVMGLQAMYFDIAFQLGHYVIVIAKIAVVIAVVNLGLNFWLIPIIDIKGAAIATLTSFLIGGILSIILGRKHFKLPFPLIEFSKIIVASFVMGFCLWWLKDLRGWGWLMLQLSVGTISYLTIIIAFNILDIRSHIKIFWENR